MNRRFDNRMQYGNPGNTPPMPGHRSMRQRRSPLNYNQGIPNPLPPVQVPYPPNNNAPFPPNHSQPFLRNDMAPNGGNEKKGGLISKLFRKSKTNNQMPANPFSLPSNHSRSVATAAAATSTASSGGFLQNLINPANLTTMLNNTQSVLQAAESLTPYVQQYGPLIKNIPAMWNLYRGKQDTDTDTDENNVTTTEQATVLVESPIKERITPKRKEQIIESSIQDLKPVRIQPKRKPKIKPTVIAVNESSPLPGHTWRKGESKPKLFI